MDEVPDLSDTEATVLRAVHAEGRADLYALAQAVGSGPRTVQEAVRALARKDLVIVSDRGSTVHCTPSGEDVARTGDPNGEPQRPLSNKKAPCRGGQDA